MSRLQEFNKASVLGASKNMREEKLGQNSNTNANTARPSSGKKTNSKSEVGSKSERIDSGKLLQDKHVEERKRKNEERKAAVEERRKQKEKEERIKNEALRQIIDSKGPPSKTGRKLPSVPSDFPKRETSATRRFSSSSSSSDSTPLGSGKNTRTRRNLTGPTSASTSSLNSIAGTQNLNKPRSNLATSKKGSISTNNLNDKTTGTKKAEVTGAPSRRSTGSILPKAQSMGAIHQLGTKSSRSSMGKKAKPKPVHHAGSNTEEEARLALAEHRKKMRQEAERKALLDKEKQEELRRQREEEEKRLAEENAREMARQAELAKQLEAQQAERAALLRKQREKEAAIEAERAAAELKHKEELEELKRQEIERRAKEAEKREREEEERVKREEIARQERRKRVEMIMTRTRMTATVNSNMTSADSYASLEDLSMKLSDECHSSTVSEILQKVKEKSRSVSPSPEKDTERQKENQQCLENSGRDAMDGRNEYPSDVFREIDNSKNTEMMSAT